MTASTHAIMGYAKTAGSDRSETLRLLREDVQQAQIRRKTRGLDDLPEEEVLLTYLRKLTEAPQALGNLPLPGAEISEKELRSLRLREIACGPSRRSEPIQQFTRKHPNTLQALSQLLAHDAEKAWVVYRGQNAPPLVGTWNHNWEYGIRRVATGIPARVDRLSGLGNAIVPILGCWIGKVIMKFEQERKL